jgi:hypothetical protein
MEQFDTKIASLTYLTNPLYQQIIKQQKEIKSASNKSDIKFYRKRITSLTKDMLKGEIPDNSYIKSIYETYVNGLIKYFKMVDTSDIIQKQYNDDVTQYTEEHVSKENIESNIESNIEDDINTIKEVSIDKADDLLMRRISGPSTLDNFVIKTDNTNPDTRIIPVILDVDLKEPSLKKKGVKDKVKKDTSKKYTSKKDTYKKDTSKLDVIDEDIDENIIL